MINRTVLKKPERKTVVARDRVVHVLSNPGGTQRLVRWAQIREAERQLAEAFGFLSWSAFANWHDNKCPDLNLDIVRGPHALTLLKMLAIKHKGASRD